MPRPVSVFPALAAAALLSGCAGFGAVSTAGPNALEALRADVDLPTTGWTMASPAGAPPVWIATGGLDASLAASFPRPRSVSVLAIRLPERGGGGGNSWHAARIDYDCANRTAATTATVVRDYDEAENSERTHTPAARFVSIAPGTLAASGFDAVCGAGAPALQPTRINGSADVIHDYQARQRRASLGY